MDLAPTEFLLGIMSAFWPSGAPANPVAASVSALEWLHQQDLRSIILGFTVVGRMLDWPQHRPSIAHARTTFTFVVRHPSAHPNQTTETEPNHCNSSRLLPSFSHHTELHCHITSDPSRT